VLAVPSLVGNRLKIYDLEVTSEGGSQELSNRARESPNEVGRIAKFWIYFSGIDAESDHETALEPVSRSDYI
jgi:hypothetical protein